MYIIVLLKLTKMISFVHGVYKLVLYFKHTSFIFFFYKTLIKCEQYFLSFHMKEYSKQYMKVYDWKY